MMTAPRPVALRIGTLRLSGDGLTHLEARRLADELPAALARAASAWPEIATPRLGMRPGLADMIAARIVGAAVARSPQAEAGQP